jgi:hypothetical protein
MNPENPVSNQIRHLCEKASPATIDAIEFGEVIFEIRQGKVYRIKLIQSVLVKPEGAENAKG